MTGTKSWQRKYALRAQAFRSAKAVCERRLKSHREIWRVVEFADNRLFAGRNIEHARHRAYLRGKVDEDGREGWSL